MMKYEIRASQVEDTLIIGNDMREADKYEIWASHRVTPQEALNVGFHFSTIVKTATVNGVAMSMFGVVENAVNPHEASVWMLGTNKMLQHKNWVAKSSRTVIKDFLKRYKRLYNYVDARNQKSIEWLEWCGAKIEPAKPYGKEGLNFHFFSIERVS